MKISVRLTSSECGCIFHHHLYADIALIELMNFPGGEGSHTLNKLLLLLSMMDLNLKISKR